MQNNVANYVISNMIFRTQIIRGKEDNSYLVTLYHMPGYAWSFSYAHLPDSK